MVVTALDESWGIPVGTEVYTADGERLGSVVEGDAYELVVERGFFIIIHAYQIRLSEVDWFEDGKLVLRLTKADAEQQREEAG